MLKEENVIIYEAAISFQNLFIRIDILVKEGNQFQLIEVKSKSFNGDDESLPWQKKKGGIVSKWNAYLFDIAFQKYIFQNALPSSQVAAYILLCDKANVASVDGLNARFEIKRDGQNIQIKKNGSWELHDLGKKILSTMNVDNEVEHIFSGGEKYSIESESFDAYVNPLSAIYDGNQYTEVLPGRKCKGCEFQTSFEEINDEVKSGLHQCWSEYFKKSISDFNQPLLTELWDNRQFKSQLLSNKLFLKDLNEDDLNVQLCDDGLHRTERQYLQVKYARGEVQEPFYIDKEAIKTEMDSWVYPLHFIDFETTMAAVPFIKGHRPYEAVAFQYSHHQVDIDENGELLISHASQFLSHHPGQFPNFDFIRALRRDMLDDHGMIFRYSPHENTFLKHIYREIEQSSLKDKDDLQGFIRMITHSSDEKTEEWEGNRAMVDLFPIVKKYFYHPAMKGSNSIKAVLPAIISSSPLLQEKYSQSIYGTDMIPSHNFKGWTWIQRGESGQILDPYRLLPKMYEDYDDEDIEKYFKIEGIQNGGAAMTAYAKLQYEKISENERAEICDSLLKYCELDTLAMVMIYEGWKELVG